jgi:diguanylate cyclase (GGDEF)-like protein/PAS domain S-box-containing protein/putative nucleotidyltransferase with HDIG domain
MNDKFYRHLVDELSIAISYNKILLDEKGIPYDYEIIEVNKAYEKLIKREKSDIVGRRITEILPEVRASQFDWIHFCGDVALNGGEKEMEHFYDPLGRWFKLTVYSFEKYYFTSYVLDITKEMSQLTEIEKLIDISEELILNTEHKNDYQKISDDFLKISGAKYAMFNLFDEDGKSFTMKAITGDKGIIQKAINILGYKFEDKKWAYDIEHANKIQLKTITRFNSLKELTGKIIPAPLTAMLEKSFNMGEVIVIKITMQNVMLGDITLFMEKGKNFDKDTLAEVYARQLGMFITRKRAEDALFKEKRLIDSIFYSTPGMIYLYDDQSRLVRWNKKHEDITGYSAEELSEMTLLDWYKDDELSQKAVKEGISRAFKEGFGDAEADLQKKDGTTLPMYFTASPLNFEGKQYFTGIAIDITERRRREAEIYHLSYRDQLTGLYNRRFYEEELIRLDTERNLPLTLVMGDVNGLKLINDSFGHVIGDRFLKKVAEVMVKGCRADDIVARLAGDEYVIILPKTDAFEAKQIIKRIKELSVKEKIDSIDISISFGYGTKYNVDENIEEIFKIAEDNMYKKKLFEGPNMRGKTINVIINSLYEKNKREELHSLQVSALCKSMGEALGLTENEIDSLKTAGLLHDIGKIAIDEDILNKPGKLTEEEHDELKRHSEIGYRMLNTVINMTEIAKYILHHHERWNGKGYPKGLKGDDIPYFSRIIAIANFYDDLTSEKVYEAALPKEIVIEKLLENAGSKFDPELVRVFVEKVYKAT